MSLQGRARARAPRAPSQPSFGRIVGCSDRDLSARSGGDENAETGGSYDFDFDYEDDSQTEIDDGLRARRRWRGGRARPRRSDGGVLPRRRRLAFPPLGLRSGTPGTLSPLSTPLTPPATARLLLSAALLAACSTPDAAPEAFTRAPLRPDSLEANGWDRDCDLLHVEADLTIDYDARLVSGTVTSRIRALVSGTPDRAAPRGRARDRVDPRRPGPRARVPGRGARPARRPLAAARPRRRAVPRRALLGAPPRRASTSSRARRTSRASRPRCGPRGSSRTIGTGCRSGTFRTTARTFELKVRVGHGMSVVSNGELVEAKDYGQGERTFHWRLDQEIPTYLIGLAAGRWERYADDWRGIPVEYYVAPGHGRGEGAPRVRRDAAHDGVLLRAPRRRLPLRRSTPRSAVAEFTGLGMENASVTFQNDYLIGTAEEVADLEERAAAARGARARAPVVRQPRSPASAGATCGSTRRGRPTSSCSTRSTSRGPTRSGCGWSATARLTSARGGPAPPARARLAVPGRAGGRHAREPRLHQGARGSST